MVSPPDVCQAIANLRILDQFTTAVTSRRVRSQDRNQLKKQALEVALKLPRRAPSKLPASIVPRVIKFPHFDLSKVVVAKGGWLGKPAVPSSESKEWSMEDIKDAGIEIEKWDGKCVPSALWISFGSLTYNSSGALCFSRTAKAVSSASCPALHRNVFQLSPSSAKTTQTTSKRLSRMSTCPSILHVGRRLRRVSSPGRGGGATSTPFTLACRWAWADR